MIYSKRAVVVIVIILNKSVTRSIDGWNHNHRLFQVFVTRWLAYSSTTNYFPKVGGSRGQATTNQNVGAFM